MFQLNSPIFIVSPQVHQQAEGPEYHGLPSDDQPDEDELAAVPPLITATYSLPAFPAR